jgi:hypothetical protein
VGVLGLLIGLAMPLADAGGTCARAWPGGGGCLCSCSCLLPCLAAALASDGSLLGAP